MSYFYFSENWVSAMYHKLPTKYEKTRKRNASADIAKRILSEIKPDDVKFEEGYAIVCSKSSEWNYNHYGSYEFKEVEEEIKKELMDHFGLESEVIMWISDTVEEEPDPIPPLYWGGTDTHYHYSLTIKIKLPE